MFVNRTQAFDDNGGQSSLKVQYILTFSKVLATDDRVYICNAKNSAGSDNLDFRATVVAGPGNDSKWMQNGLIGIGVAAGLLLPLAYFMFRRRQQVVNRMKYIHENDAIFLIFLQRNTKLLKLYERFKFAVQDQIKEGLENTNPNERVIETLDILPTAVHKTYKKLLQQAVPHELEIQPEQLTIDHSVILGKGAFGVVYQGILDKEKIVAVKTIPKNGNEVHLAALLSEVKIMNYVGEHPHIMQLLGVQNSALRKGKRINQVFIIFEFKCALFDKRNCIRGN